LHLTFASIGLFLSVLLRRSKNFLPVSLGVVLFSYFLGIASTLSDKIDFLKYLSPFKYLDAIDIISQAAFQADTLILMIAINLLTIFLTYRIYNKKDFAA
jgi:ABC-2 type transport system permease protein